MRQPWINKVLFFFFFFFFFYFFLSWLRDRGTCAALVSVLKRNDIRRQRTER